MQIYLIFTRQILQSGLRVGDKNSFIFHDKSGDAVLLAIPNLWDNIQIVRTHILKHNVTNFVSFTTRYLDFETLLLWDTLDMNNFYFLFLLFSDFIGILFSFSFSFHLDDEEAHDIEVT